MTSLAVVRHDGAAALPQVEVAVVGDPGPDRDEICWTLAACPRLHGPTVTSGVPALAGRRLDLIVLRTSSPAEDVRGLRRDGAGGARVVVVSAVAGPDVVEALREGADSYLVEGQFGGAELLVAVRTTASGHSHLSPAALAAVVHWLHGPEPLGACPAVLAVLSRREREIMTLVAAGHSNAGVARELFLAEKTVRNHLNSVYRKLAVGSRAEAVITWLGRTPLASAARTA